MSISIVLALLVGHPLVADALAGISPAPASAPTASAPGVATIDRTASTNRAGYYMRIAATGAVTVQLPTLTRIVHVEMAAVTQLFVDLERAGSLDELPAGHCLKSASFGTTTSIEYNGGKSPDLQCAQTVIEHALQADVYVIENQALKEIPQRRSTLPVFRRPAPENI